MNRRDLNRAAENARALVQLLQGVDLRAGGAEVVGATRRAKVAGAELSVLLDGVAARHTVLLPDTRALDAALGRRRQPRSRQEAFQLFWNAIEPEVMRMAADEGLTLPEWIERGSKRMQEISPRAQR